MATRMAEIQREIDILERKILPAKRTIAAYEAQKRRQHQNRIDAAKTANAAFEAKYQSVMWEVDHAMEIQRISYILKDSEQKLEALKAERKALISWPKRPK